MFFCRCAWPCITRERQKAHDTWNLHSCRDGRSLWGHLWKPFEAEAAASDITEYSYCPCVWPGFYFHNLGSIPSFEEHTWTMNLLLPHIPQRTQLVAESLRIWLRTPAIQTKDPGSRDVHGSISKAFHCRIWEPRGCFKSFPKWIYAGPLAQAPVITEPQVSSLFSF